MSGYTLKQLKSVVVVVQKNKTSVIYKKPYHSQKLLKSKIFPQLKRSVHSGDVIKNQKNAIGEKEPTAKKNLPSLESLSRHANYRPLGVNDDWGPLSHKHELMPMDKVRYWHQHRCEVCDKLFEHKHKQRGNESMTYNQHICSVCGGTKGSRRVEWKNRQSSTDFRKNRY